MPVYNHFYLIDNKFNSKALLKDEILLKVEITPPAQLVKKRKNQKVKPFSGLALLDTGASITCVNKDLLASLKIPPVGISQVYTPSGKAQQNTYPVEISFPQSNLPKVAFNQVLGSDLKGQEIVALIGRDVLQHFVLIYNGPGGFISLAH